MAKAINIPFIYEEYNSPDDLNPDDRELILTARDAALKAYAPYSGFLVGAAVRLNSGKIVVGTNVENAAFPSGICAERNALSNASANHPDDIPVALAIAAATADGMDAGPVSPCGNCRQVIAEEEYRSGKNIRILLSGKDKIQIIEKGGELLPLQFNRNNLKLNPR